MDKLSGVNDSASDSHAGGMGSRVRDPVAERDKGGSGVDYYRSGLFGIRRYPEGYWYQGNFAFFIPHSECK